MTNITIKPEFEVNGKWENAVITVPHRGKKLRFKWPGFGEGRPLTGISSFNERLYDAGLYGPTFAEIISLIYSAKYNSEHSKHANEIWKDFNGYRWIETFTNVMTLPNVGVYVSNHSQNGVLVPFSYKGGSQSVEDLVQNPFVRAIAEDQECMDKMADILGNRHADVCGPSEKKKYQSKTFVALEGPLCIDGLGGDICGGGYYREDIWPSHTYGVIPTRGDEK